MTNTPTRPNGPVDFSHGEQDLQHQITHQNLRPTSLFSKRRPSALLQTTGIAELVFPQDTQLGQHIIFEYPENKIAQI